MKLLRAPNGRDEPFPTAGCLGLIRGLVSGVVFPSIWEVLVLDRPKLLLVGTALAAFTSLVGAGCKPGTIGGGVAAAGAAGASGVAGGTGTTGSAGTGGVSGGDPVGVLSGAKPGAAFVPAASTLRRLTVAQYRNTLRELAK